MKYHPSMFSDCDGAPGLQNDRLVHASAGCHLTKAKAASHLSFHERCTVMCPKLEQLQGERLTAPTTRQGLSRTRSEPSVRRGRYTPPPIRPPSIKTSCYVHIVCFLARVGSGLLGLGAPAVALTAERCRRKGGRTPMRPQRGAFQAQHSPFSGLYLQSSRLILCHFVLTHRIDVSFSHCAGLPGYPRQSWPHPQRVFQESPIEIFSKGCKGCNETRPRYRR